MTWEHEKKLEERLKSLRLRVQFLEQALEEISSNPYNSPLVRMAARDYLDRSNSMFK